MYLFSTTHKIMNAQHRQAPRHPDLKIDRLALWIKTNRFGKPYYNIAERLPYVPCIYTTASAECNGAKLSPHDALELYRGNSIEVQMHGRYGSYTVILAMRSIEVRSDPNVSGNETRFMILAMIFPLSWKGVQSGYKIEGITVPNTIGSGSSGPTKLKPCEALMLLEGKTLKLGQHEKYTVVLSHVEEEVLPDRTIRIARISATLGPQEELPDPIYMVPLGAPPARWAAGRTPANVVSALEGLTHGNLF